MSARSMIAVTALVLAGLAVARIASEWPGSDRSPSASVNSLPEIPDQQLADSAPTSSAFPPASRGVSPPAPVVEESIQTATRVPFRLESVLVQHGRLSVNVRDRPLGWLLEIISREASVAIMAAESIRGQIVTDEFSKLPLDVGLRRLLGWQDAFFYYDGGALSAVWVFAPGEGRGREPTPPELWASTAEFEAKLNDPDPKTRARAIEVVVERKGEKAREAVLRAVTDDADRVRTQALYAAIGEGLELPAETLIELALNDPAVNVRFLALDALSLARDPRLVGVAQAALDDSSPHIQSKAHEILERLGTVERRQPDQVQ